MNAARDSLIAALRVKADAVLKRCEWCAAGVKRTPLGEQFRDYLGHPHAEHFPEDIAAVDLSALPVGFRSAKYPMHCGLDNAPYELAVAAKAVCDA